MLADPKSALSAVCLDKISRYIHKGGNMFILGEPGKQQMVNPVLKQLGVSLMDGVLVSQHKREMPQMQIAPFHQCIPEHGASILPVLHSKKYRKKTGTCSCLMRQLSIIADTAGFTCTPLLKSEAGLTWLKKGKLVVDSAMVEFNEQDGDIRNFFASLQKQICPR